MKFKQKKTYLVEHTANDLEINFSDVMFRHTVEEILSCLHTHTYTHTHEPLVIIFINMINALNVHEIYTVHRN